MKNQKYVFDFPNKTILIPSLYVKDYKLLIDSIDKSASDYFDILKYNFIEKMVYISSRNIKEGNIKDSGGLIIENNLFISFGEVLMSDIKLNNTTKHLLKSNTNRIAIAISIFNKSCILNIEEHNNVYNIIVDKVLGRGVLTLDENINLISSITEGSVKKDLIMYYLSLVSNFLDINGMMMMFSSWKPK